MTRTLFAFSDVVVERDGVRALDGFTAAIPDVGITAIIGPSGSGKSTMLRLCNRLVVPSAGRVAYRGSDIIDLDPLQLRRRVGMCFQRPIPFAGTVAENLRVADPDATDEQMNEVLEQVALGGDWLERDATALSGGEAQRMCLARTLITRPEVLLLDEPTSSLDPTGTRTVEAAVRKLVEGSLRVVWVSHDAEQVGRIADHLIEITGGQCIRQSSCQDGPPVEGQKP
jgi:putative ABC transport system ATP-binding protein